MTHSMYRQGDLLFTELIALPKGLKAREDNIILEGEATGHSHHLLDGRVLEDERGMRYLKVLRATLIVHPEHDVIRLPPGCYLVRRQREYTPKVIRVVRD